MDSSELVYEIKGALRVYKNGTVERFIDTDFVPPSFNLPPSISSKDITIISHPNISARLYLPEIDHPQRKLPVLLYFHGGAFCLSSPFTKKYHNYVAKLVSQANIVAVSVNYRKAPEHPIPSAFEDSQVALHWIASHSNNDGPEPWINDHVDFGRVFLAGESSGGNIAHNLAMSAAGVSEFEILGLALVHPFFWGSGCIASEALDPDRKAAVDGLWPMICPSNPDNDDPRVNPVGDGGAGLIGLGCKRVFVAVSEKDILKDRGWIYYNVLSRSGWMGVAEIYETEGEEHGFHLNDFESEKAKDLIESLCFFFNRDMPSL
ncbi:alpha/beta-Hydrolases superfamily protein [Euphorbia peplus]|nr:alpha/beta-Hydrolases superfamily protein [Euphorbia peplus]